MSNWRDRNERDAVPPRVRISSEDLKKDPEKDTLSAANLVIIFSSILISLASLISLIFPTNRISSSTNVSSSTSNNVVPVAEISQFICKDIQGYSGIWATSTSGKERLLITFKNGAMLKSNTNYVDKQKCNALASKINKHIDSPSENYSVMYDFNQYPNKLCVVKNSDYICSSKNTLINIY